MNQDADRTPKTEHEKRPSEDGKQIEKPYIKPTVMTHSGEEILDELGPAQACYPFGGCGISV